MRPLKKSLSPVPRATERSSVRYVRVIIAVPARNNCQPLLRLLPISLRMSSQLPLWPNSSILVQVHLSIPSLPTLECWFTAFTLSDSEKYYMHESSCHFPFMGQFDIQSTGLVGIRKPGLWNLSRVGQCCFSLMGLVLHYSPNALAFIRVVNFKRKRLHSGMQLCFGIKHQVFVFYFPRFIAEGPGSAQTGVALFCEVTETELTLNFGRSLCRPPSRAAQASWNTEFPIGAVEFGLWRSNGSIRPLYGSQMCWLLLIFHFLCHS